MTAGWVAGSVRGRLLTQRRLGAGGARKVAIAGGTAAAVEVLARSPYGRDVHPGASAEDARRAVGAVCLWHLRVLAGWLPPRGGEAVRVFASRFELENVADRLAAVAGAPTPVPYDLGALAVAWPRIAAAPSDALRGALAESPWGDPGTATWPAAAPALEARWATWLAAVPGGTEWAAGAAALVAARLVASGQEVPSATRIELGRQLGPRWTRAPDVAGLAHAAPAAAAWVLDGVSDPEDLWLAEGRWWRRVDRDAAGLMRAARPGPAVAAASAARLAVDAWRARAALEAAAWGRRGLEAFDAVA